VAAIILRLEYCINVGILAFTAGMRPYSHSKLLPAWVTVAINWHFGAMEAVLVTMVKAAHPIGLKG
jgi:hypothetical protein